MTLLSKLRPLLQALRSQTKSGKFLSLCNILRLCSHLLGLPQNLCYLNTGSRQMSDHRVFPMEPSRWAWTKFKDYAHFYFMLGLIPCSLVVTGMNVFIGPATLSEIPEGYTPKYWEYYKVSSVPSDQQEVSILWLAEPSYTVFGKVLVQQSTTGL